MHTAMRSRIGHCAAIFFEHFAVLLQALIDRLRHLAQRQLSQSNQVGLAEEIFQRPAHAFLRIDVAAPHPVLQRFRRQVDHHHFVDALQHPVRHRLPHLNSRHALHRRRHALQVLDVHGRKHIDAGIQQFEHVFVALAVFAALDVGVRQFIDQRDPRMARENRVHVHLFKLSRPCTRSTLRGTTSSCVTKSANRFAPVSFDHSDNHIFAAAVPPNRLRQHGVRLADAGSVAEKELEHAALSSPRCRFLQPLVGSLRHRAIIVVESAWFVDE